MTTDPKAFLGVGWSFPVQTTRQDQVDLVAYEDDIRQAIQIILGTNLGERVMRPNFGGGLRALVFQPLNTGTLAMAQQTVQRALIQWEPRIDVISVSATVDPTDNTRTRLLISIQYQVRATNSYYNLVYPFYLTEGSPA